MGVVRSLFKRLELLLRSFTLVSVPLIRVGDCKTKDPMSYFRLVSVMTATLTRESTYLICTARVYYVVAHLEFLPIKIVLEPWGDWNGSVRARVLPTSLSSFQDVIFPDRD